MTDYADQVPFADPPEAAERLEFELVNERVDEVALFTDGLQNLALHFQTQTAHTPFFRPMFEWLRPAPEGRREKLSASLAAFLDSPKVNDCTDDDKTLILATRRDIEVIGTHNSQNDESAGL